MNFASNPTTFTAADLDTIAFVYGVSLTRSAEESTPAVLEALKGYAHDDLTDALTGGTSMIGRTKLGLVEIVHIGGDVLVVGAYGDEIGRGTVQDLIPLVSALYYVISE